LTVERLDGLRSRHAHDADRDAPALPGNATYVARYADWMAGLFGSAASTADRDSGVICVHRLRSRGSGA